MVLCFHQLRTLLHSINYGNFLLYSKNIDHLYIWDHQILIRKILIAILYFQCFSIVQLINKGLLKITCQFQTKKNPKIIFLIYLIFQYAKRTINLLFQNKNFFIYNSNNTYLNLELINALTNLMLLQLFTLIYWWNGHYYNPNFFHLFR